MYTHMNFTGKGFIGSAEVTSKDDKKKGLIRIAKTDTWKDKDGNRQERSQWYSLVVFSPKLVEMMESGWIGKGRYVEVEGEIRDNRWTDNNGEEHFDTQLIANRIQFLDKKPQDD